MTFIYKVNIYWWKKKKMLPKKINILQVVGEENNMKIKNNLKTIKLNNMNKCFNFLGALWAKKIQK